MPETGVDVRKTVRGVTPGVSDCPRPRRPRWLASSATNSVRQLLGELTKPDCKLPSFDPTITARVHLACDIAAAKPDVWLSVLAFVPSDVRTRLVTSGLGGESAVSCGRMHDELTTWLRGKETCFLLCSGRAGQNVLAELVRSLPPEFGGLRGDGSFEVSIQLRRFCHAHRFDGSTLEVLSGYDRFRAANNRDGELRPLLSRVQEADQSLGLFVSLLAMSKREQAKLLRVDTAALVEYAGVWRALLAKGLQSGKLAVGREHYRQQLHVLRKIRRCLRKLAGNIAAVHEE